MAENQWLRELESAQMTYRPCANGHIFVWAGDPIMKLPEGYPCECGATLAHYEKCGDCQHASLKPIAARVS